MEITVNVRDVYGNRLIYPVCDKAKAFAAIAGKKTLTFDMLLNIKALGFAVVVQQPTVSI